MPNINQIFCLNKSTLNPKNSIIDKDEPTVNAFKLLIQTIHSM